MRSQVSGNRVSQLQSMDGRCRPCSLGLEPAGGAAWGCGRACFGWRQNFGHHMSHHMSYVKGAAFAAGGAAFGVDLGVGSGVGGAHERSCFGVPNV